MAQYIHEMTAFDEDGNAVVPDLQGDLQEE